jgi:hypothetical protein
VNAIDVGMVIGIVHWDHAAMQAHPSIDLDQGVGGGEGASMLEAAARPEPKQTSCSMMHRTPFTT